MTKRVNRLFLIVAVFLIVLTVLIPIVDYYITKTKIMDKGNFTTAIEYGQANADISNAINGEMQYLDNFYSYFAYNYDAVNKNSILYIAINNLKKGEFTKIEMFGNNNPEAEETYFIFYILDKVLWLFVAYCIFVIPISMVDLFSKVIKKGVE